MADGVMTRRFIAILVPILAFGVLWNTLTIKVVETNPALAAQVRPGNEIILQRQALVAFPPEAASSGAIPARALDPVIRYGQASLRRSALTPNAAGVVGFAMTLQQDRAGAARLLAAQEQVGWRDRLLLLTAMIHHAGREEPKAAIAAMATLSRIQRTPDATIFPAIISLAQYDEAMPALLDLLESKPTWRARFMGLMGQIPENGPLFSRLIAGLIDRETQFSVEELHPFFMVNRHALPLADQWALWQRAYPVAKAGERQPLRDGDFERISGPPPYSWRVGELGEVSSALVPRADGASGNWLAATVNGDAENEVTSQFITAAPGKWTFSIAMSVDSGLTERVAFVVHCLPRRNILAEKEVAAGAASPSAASPTALSFTVPAQGCAQQELRILAKRNISETPFTVQLDNAVMERGS